MYSTLLSLVLATQVGLVDQSPNHVLDPADLSPGSLVGGDVELCGDFAFVAASAYSGSSLGAGRVDVWKRCPTGYQLHQELEPIPGIPTSLFNLRFGFQIEASEEFLAVRSFGGLPDDPAALGLVHIFQLVDGQWIATDIIRAIQDPFLFNTGFGESLTIYDHELVVGAPGYGDVSHHQLIRGAVHIYDLDNNGRAHFQQTVQASPLSHLSKGFGDSSDLYDDVLVVGHPGGGGGEVHVYHRSGRIWNLVQTMDRPGGSSSEYWFGVNVSIDRLDRSIFISDPAVSPNERDGTVYRYSYNRGAVPYTLAESFRATEDTLVPQLGDLFGESFEVRGDVLAIGSQHQSIQGVRSGVCELYRRRTNGWQFAGRFTVPSDWPAINLFGNEVAVCDGRVLVADSSWQSADGSNFGRCYVWEISSAAEICSLPGDESHINICRQDGSPSVVDVTVSGLDFDGIVGLAVGAVNVDPAMSSGLCIQRPRRLGSAMAVTASQSTAIFTDLSLDSNAGSGFAVQAFYLRSNSAPRLAIGPAVALFE